MTPERWQKIHTLFAAVLRCDAEQRSPFLDVACAGDPSLRADLDDLLAQDEQAEDEGFLRPTSLATGQTAGLPAGQRIGPYEVRERIASGGMGSVYRAVRVDDYRQEVALKLIRPGLESDELVRRFRTERQVLAGLNHPHIARLLDGGTTADGLPYFVMEYIDGLPLHRFCDGQQLAVRQRLELFRRVCEAVHYAHERGVVHRDLKPANVLVTADGTPKVTDFGIAKRLHGEPGTSALAGQTQSGAVLGTPSYMAPEQAAPSPKLREGKEVGVGPAADVYALGALLYELLTGRPPFRAETPLQTLAQVLEEEPVPPGRLHPRLERDVETICLKCLQKAPWRRYASAQELADDVGRFLAGEPIRARAAPWWQRAGKWARRRPTAAALAGVSAAAVVAVLLVSGLYNVRLKHERDAVQRKQEALALTVRTLDEVAEKQLDPFNRDTHTAYTEADLLRMRGLLQELANNEADAPES